MNTNKLTMYSKLNTSSTILQILWICLCICVCICLQWIS